MADGGTIFLDEIGEMPLELQCKLLRVIQDGEFERLGSPRTIKVDVRIIAASNRNLEEEVHNGRFREDLFYRLNVFPIMIPPLRQRKEDIPLLVNHIVAKFNKKMGKKIDAVLKDTLTALQEYHWPGNVRELENCIERAVLLSGDEVIHAHHLPPSLQSAESTGTAQPGTLPETLEALERDLILDALKSSRGNKAKAARALGITERLIGIRVARLGINWRRFRSAGSAGTPPAAT